MALMDQTPGPAAKVNKHCSFEGCDNPSKSTGLCQTHYMQRRRGVELRPIRAPRPAAPEGQWWCGRGKHFQPIDQFGWDITRNQPRRACKVCVAEVQRAYLDRADVQRSDAVLRANADRQRRWYANNRERARMQVRLKKFGITLEEYERLLDGQEGRCAICGSEDWRGYGTPCIDHDHATGAVRGLLCSMCNAALGQFEDDVSRLEAAAEYLRKYAPVRSD